MKAGEERRKYLYMLKKLHATSKTKIASAARSERDRNNGDRRVKEKDNEYRIERRALANHQRRQSSLYYY